MTVSGNFECLQNFSFETDFLENENLFQKTGIPFLVESAKIENVSFPCKTVISEVNVRINRMMSTKFIAKTYHKERSLASNYFIFLKMLFRIKNLLQRVDLMYQRLKCPYPYFL